MMATSSMATAAPTPARSRAAAPASPTASLACRLAIAPVETVSSPQVSSATMAICSVATVALALVKSKRAAVAPVMLLACCPFVLALVVAMLPVRPAKLATTEISSTVTVALVDARLNSSGLALRCSCRGQLVRRFAVTCASPSKLVMTATPTVAMAVLGPAQLKLASLA